MAGKRTTQFPNRALAFTDTDVMDVSKHLSTGPDVYESEQFLLGDLKAYINIGTGTGDVTGGASSTDNSVVVYDGTTGKIIKNQGSVIIDPSTGDLKLAAGLFMAGDQIISSNGAAVIFGNVGGGVTDILLKGPTGQYVTMSTTDTNIGGETITLISESIGDNIVVIDTNGNVDFSSTSGTAVRLNRNTTSEEGSIPSLANGMIWYNTSTNKFRGRQNGVTVDLISTGGVTSVSGTTNRITSTGGSTPIIDIDAAYVGQSSITTLGTIGTGTWNGSVVTGQYGGTGVANTGKTITLAGNLITTGAFNTTLAAQATITTTLPPVATTLAGKTGTMVAGYVGVWNDANQLTGSSAITASGGALTITGLMKSAGIETSVRYLAFISGSDTGGAANAIVMFNAGISQGWSTQLKANHDLAFFGYTGGYTEFVRFGRATGAVNMATSLYVGSISATNSGIVNIKGGSAGSSASFALKTYWNDGTTISSYITDAGDGYFKSSLTIDTTTFKILPTVSLSAAQIKTGYSSPIQLVAAPGTGYAIAIIVAPYNFTVGTAFTSTIIGLYGTSQLGSNPAANTAPILNGASSVFEPMYLSSGAGITVLGDNEALWFSTDADSAVGTGTCKLYVTYQIIKL